MENYTIRNRPLCRERPDGVHGGFGAPEGCGVTEEAFPRMGTCCGWAKSVAGMVYSAVCPHCSVWTSLPDGASLAVAHIVECAVWGYGRRVQNES